MTGEHRFEVLQNARVADGIWKMVCRTQVAGELRAGQFVNVRVPGDGAHILRVPLSFSRADGEADELEMVYAVVGEGTKRLSCMRAGDASTLVGPCGNGWRLPQSHGRALLVAGGVGLPPLVALSRLLDAAHVSHDAVVGAQTASKHVDCLLDALGSVVVTTDDGTRGMRGLTTAAMADLLAEHRYEQVYACGPQPMMAGVARMAADLGIACQVSLERLMGCGFGACSCCNVALVGGGYALCCQDGPVFDAKEVAW